VQYLHQLKQKFVDITQKSLFRNTLWMLLGKLLGILLQGGYFIIVARALGTENFGAFMGVSAFAMVVTPFGAIGSADLLVRNVARNPNLFRKYWGDALVTAVLSSSLVIVLSLWIAQYILPRSIPDIVIFLILLSDVFGLAVWNIAGGAFVAVNLHRKTAQLQICLNFTKLLSALSLVVFFENPNPVNWSFLYFIGTISTTLICFLAVSRVLGFPKFSLSAVRANIGQGIFFSLDSSAGMINASIDKTMLARLSTLSVTGLYAAAYRLLEVSYLPMLVIFGSTYARFFQEGASGINGSLKFAKRLLPIIALYGLATFIGYMIFAPIVPYLLGESYSESITILRWLAPMPLIVGIRLIAADTLTGAGHQKARASTQLVAAVFNISLNYYLIPIYSWKGAVWATLATDSLVALASWGVVYFYYRRQMEKEKKYPTNI